MHRWLKLLVIAALVSVPTLAYAASQAAADGCCEDGCKCDKCGCSGCKK